MGDTTDSSSSSSSTSNDEYTELKSKNRKDYQAQASASAALEAEAAAENDDDFNDDTTLNLPSAVHQALVEMPHDNSRKTTVPWYELYDQNTLELVYEMYHHDFDVFGYDIDLKQRPDLHAPPRIEWRSRSASASSSESKTAFADVTSAAGNNKKSETSPSLSLDGKNDEERWYPGYYASKLGTGYYAS